MKLDISLKKDLISYVLLACESLCMIVCGNAGQLVSVVIFIVIALLNLNTFTSAMRILKRKLVIRKDGKEHYGENE